MFVNGCSVRDRPHEGAVFCQRVRETEREVIKNGGNVGSIQKWIETERQRYSIKMIL